ncbi:hypothetical protein [Caloramator sp. Dgby_cultured_2]|uniref:hypothetical protein n=1 Tax=Caloramator sp. Dgby_cultured_2 TaxID=3029174 RepID=UPI00237D970B|nr:hypothetical protein [Caloramator sp. Dgby_cultured_2]WDU84196.1 hypothetical protein PWK10_07715 [Caloramator sp. Dgby_cultured_2]
MHNPDDYDVLLNFNEKTLKWREDNKPSKDAIISITYRYSYPILVHLTDDVSIKNFGLSEHRIQDTNIKDIKTARELGKMVLRENAWPKGYGSCEVFVEGLRAGDFITVNLPKYNANGLYEIVEIEKWIEASRVRRRVTLNIADDAESRIAQRLKDFAKRISSLEASQRPEDVVVQRILRAGNKNLKINIAGSVKGGIKQNFEDDLNNLIESHVLALKRSWSSNVYSYDNLNLEEEIRKKITLNKNEDVAVSEYVKLGTAFLGKAQFGTAVWGVEVKS